MKFVAAASLVILCVVCTARRAPMRLLEPNKYLIKRNFVTGSYHYKNLSRITEPQPVRRLRLMVTLSEAT
uniref:Secreted protein n=1 Tax=Globodera pallida TaxID=36090 RepID=A0A183CFI3_GLOPA